jgi:histidine triad (HIT) family protein
MDDCVFCKIIKGEVPSSKVYENEEVLAFLDIAPVNVGHTLVIPKKHFPNIYETPENIVINMALVAKKISTALKKFGAAGVNISMNNDAAAGQIVFHSHIHVIPRIEGDGFSLWHGRRPYEEGERDEISRKIREVI